MIEKRLNKSYVGRLRDLNPGPPAPEAGIIPLDQADTRFFIKIKTQIKNICHLKKTVYIPKSLNLSYFKILPDLVGYVCGS